MTTDYEAIEDKVRSIVGSLLMCEAEKCYRRREVEKKAFYHTWHHALDVANTCILLSGNVLALGCHQLLVAAICHDVVHTNNSPDDENKSAEWVRCQLGYLPEAILAIRMTANHFKPLGPRTNLNNILMDADLKSLSLPYDQFIETNNRIAEEVMATKECTMDELYQGRLKFIKFAKDAAHDGYMYRTAYARTKWYPQALSNLTQYEKDLIEAKSPYL